MSLYGRTDSNANVTKAGIGIAASSQAKTVVFVDETEAALEANKERGLNAPGWWSYFTYTDADGVNYAEVERADIIGNRLFIETTFTSIGRSETLTFDVSDSDDPSQVIWSNAGGAASGRPRCWT